MADARFTDEQIFRERIERIYGEHAAVVLAELSSQRAGACFWQNPLITSTEDIQALEARPLPDMHGVFFVEDREGLTHSRAAELGAIYIQNPSSYFAACTLGVQPDMEVLDLAAAPGGKTIALAAMMANTGRLAAVEVVPGRFHRLKANAERCGVTNAVFYQRDGRGVGRATGERFDRVLLDAPCSSEARIRFDDPTTYHHWQPRKIKETSRKQRALIRSAYDALLPGGEMVYCTCSFAPEENELVVAHLLRRTDAKLLPVADCPDHALAGLTVWDGKPLGGNLALTVRLLPQHPWEGFFLARIQKPQTKS